VPIPQGQKVSQDTKNQIRLISDAYRQTLDGSGACVVEIGIDLIRIQIIRIRRVRIQIIRIQIIRIQIIRIRKV
jgi:hypothetical protein